MGNRTITRSARQLHRLVFQLFHSNKHGADHLSELHTPMFGLLQVCKLVMCLLCWCSVYFWSSFSSRIFPSSSVVASTYPMVVERSVLMTEVRKPYIVPNAKLAMKSCCIVPNTILDMKFPCIVPNTQVAMKSACTVSPTLNMTKQKSLVSKRLHYFVYLIMGGTFAQHIMCRILTHHLHRHQLQQVQD